MGSYIKSPLNYTGGKYKTLENIIPSFPPKLTRFVDLFAGGFNVGINVDAESIYANDQITYLVDLFRFFQETETKTTIEEIKQRIDEYKLSLTNSDGYNQLRKEYNETKNVLDLFILTCYSFNHQIRFNNNHEFNTPFGKERSSYNDSIEKNLINFSNSLKRKKIILSNADFREFDFSFLQARDLVYCDPPYLITTGSYNDGKRGFRDWTQTEDDDLLKLLSNLDERGIYFALSNVFCHKGLINDTLIEWSKHYHTTYIDKSYSNCSYHFKDRDTKTIEVLITNYKWEKETCQQLTLW